MMKPSGTESVVWLMAAGQYGGLVPDTPDDPIAIPPASIPTMGVNAKLNRGSEHLETFISEGKEFVNSGAIGIEPSNNEALTEFEFRCRISSPPDLIRWALLIGDAINRAVDAIAQAQPFNNDGRLGRLRALSNTDKHRLLHLVAGRPDEATVDIREAGNFSGSLGGFPPLGAPPASSARSPHRRQAWPEELSQRAGLPTLLQSPAAGIWGRGRLAGWCPLAPSSGLSTATSLRRGWHEGGCHRRCRLPRF